MKKLLPFRITALIVILILVSITTKGRDLQEILKSGTIRIGFDESELGTINYQMAYEFAKYMDLKVVEVVVDWETLFSKDGVRPANLETDTTIKFTPDALKNIDIYCGNVTPMAWRDRLFDFANTLISAELIISKKGSPVLTDISGLKGLKIAMMGGTSFVEHITEINKKIDGGINTIETKTTEEAKNLVAQGKADGVVLDGPEALSFMSEANGEYFIQIPITQASYLAWVVENGNPLADEVSHFMEYIKSNSILDKLFEAQFKMKYSDFEDLLESHTPVKIENRDLDKILKEKKIIVSFRERDFIYHKEGSKQFMHILAEEFANYLGVDMEYVIVPNIDEYWKNNNDTIIKDSSYTPKIFGYFDLACDIFAPLDWRKSKVTLVPVYQSNYNIMAKKSTKIQTFDDLKTLKGSTKKNTVYYEKLTEKGLSNFYLTGTDELAPAVENGKADYTLIYNSFMYPKLETKMTWGNTDICWAVRDDQKKLKQALDEFISESQKNGLLKALDAISKGEITTTSIEDYLNSYYSSSQKGTLPHIVVNAENGLPQEDVNCMFQDNKGFLWFGTHFGLVKYNGQKMQKYHIDNGLISNNINDIIQTKKGKYLIATDKGISVIVDDNITNYPTKTTVFQIYIDSKQRNWLICADGMAEFDEAIIYPANITSQDLGEIHSFQEDMEDNGYILASSTGLYHVIGNTKTNLINGNINYAFIDSDSNLWYTNADGIFFCENGIKNISKAFSINDKADIPISVIQKIKEGFDGSIWMQNTYNLYQITSLNQSAIKYSTGKDLINNTILSFLQDREQNLWIGYSGGLQKIRNNKSLRNFFPKKLDYFIASLEVDPQNNVWITSNNGIYFYSNTTGDLLQNFDIQGVSIVRQFSDGEILIINEKGLFSPDNRNNLKQILSFDFSGLKGAIISSNSEIYIWTQSGKLFYLTNKKEIPTQVKGLNNNEVSNVIEFDKQIFITILNQVYEVSGTRIELVYEHNGALDGIGFSYDALYISAHGKIINLSDTSKSFIIDDNLVIKDIIPSRNRSFVWLSTNKGVYYFNITSGEPHLLITSNDGLPGNEIVENGLYIDKTGILWILTYHGVSNYNLRSLSKVKYAPKCYLSQITVNGTTVDSTKTIFNFNENDFVFQLSGLFFSNENSIEYSYYLRGERNTSNFIRYTKENILYYDNLEPGTYELVYRAKGEDDIWSESKSYKFTIKKALWNTWGFRIFAVIAVLSVIILIYRWRWSRITKQKEELEALVDERTQDLVEANTLVTAKNEEITASIHYAERIQKSLLPKEKLFKKRFADHFIIFMPRDIVSGDFFWAYEKKDKVYISAVDCTGHGVPGAFMSMLGMSFLKEIVTRHSNAKPGVMLNDLRREIITALQQEGRLGEAKDGMDMSLVSIDTKSLVLEFAGANNPIYIIRNQSVKFEIEPEEKIKQRSELLFEITPNKMPIAIYERMDDFENITVPLVPGDTIYLFSDGFPDQFGGPKNKKLLYSRLRQTLEDNYDKNLTEQKQALMSLFNEWKGIEHQIDDVTMIGIRV